ncbi:hypothetical protein KSC_006300 [Ktedonobacter sp. SOSP1-52]|nr:hypothetical protein KSC_006300 [Ktedonobacter sp. SOSP1-52]
MERMGTGLGDLSFLRCHGTLEDLSIAEVAARASGGTRAYFVGNSIEGFEGAGQETFPQFPVQHLRGNEDWLLLVESVGRNDIVPYLELSPKTGQGQ